MKTVQGLFTLVALAAFVGSGLGQTSRSAAGEKVSLTPKYLPGKYILNMTIDVEWMFAFDDTEEPSNKARMDWTMEMTTSQPDAKGNKEIVIQITKFNETVDTSSDSTTQPSDKEKELLASITKAMLKAKITATVSPDGSINNIKGIEEAFANVSDNPTSTFAKNTIKAFFEEDSYVMEMLNITRRMLPKEPVAVGQDYTTAMKMDIPAVHVDMSLDGKIVSIDKTGKGRIATIDFQMKADKESLTTYPGVATKPVMNNIKQLVVTMSGQIKFNLDLGQTVEQKIKHVIDMEMVKGKKTMKIKTTNVVKADVTFTPAK